MKIIWRSIGVLAALVLLGLVMAYLAGLFEEKIPTEAVAVTGAQPEGTIVQVEAVEEPLIEQATGTIRAKHEAVISARIMATIAAMPVRAGDAVEEGNVLVMLDSRELEARLEQQRQQVAAAEARLAEAQSNYRRISSDA
jgi:membrane fusion protein (multidrug efflux system)